MPAIIFRISSVASLSSAVWKSDSLAVRNSAIKQLSFPDEQPTSLVNAFQPHDLLTQTVLENRSLIIILILHFQCLLFSLSEKDRKTSLIKICDHKCF